MVTELPEDLRAAEIRAAEKKALTIPNIQLTPKCQLTRFKLRPSSLTSALLVLAVATAAPEVRGASEHVQLYVAEAYMELHTGPGRGYPVFHVASREESFEILLRRTDWFQVRTSRGVEGWVSAEDISKAVTANGAAFNVTVPDRAGFEERTFEAGVQGGKFGGANLVSAFAGYSLLPQLSVEASVGQAFGRFSDLILGDVGLAYTLLPEWRLQPFFTIGGGLVHFQRRLGLPESDSGTDGDAYVGAGLRYYLTQRFFVRAEYKRREIFTSQNEEVDEWKAGFAFFY